MTQTFRRTVLLWIAAAACTGLCSAETEPLVTVLDLDVDEEQTATLPGGRSVTAKLDDVREFRDSVMGALRYTEIDVTINGEQATLVSGLYRLPVVVGGVQVDCPVTAGYNRDSHINHWGLRKAARLRLWPAGSPWIRPGTFVYPVGQKWFASQTWFSNEAVSARPNGQFYYHSGLDIGGSEKQVPVYAATDGEVVSVADRSAEGLPSAAVTPRYDVVYLRDERGWYYRYSHLDSIRTAVRLGTTVKAGQQIGIIGKEGGSGGWTHLHFEIKSVQPSGEWGTQDGYAFLWQAWQQQHKPDLIAVARPRHLAAPGETVTLDGSLSWGREQIVRYAWTFTDGTTADGAKIERTYTRPGTYSEILTVTDAAGRTDVDFAIVKVADANQQANVPGMHPVYYPTMKLKPGDPITFKVRARNTTEGVDVWDFGDGSAPVTVKSNPDPATHAPDGYAATIHRYEKPGQYVVAVRRETSVGNAIGHLYVVVDEP